MTRTETGNYCISFLALRSRRFTSMTALACRFFCGSRFCSGTFLSPGPREFKRCKSLYYYYLLPVQTVSCALGRRCLCRSACADLVRRATRYPCRSSQMALPAAGRNRQVAARRHALRSDGRGVIACDS